MANGEGRGVTRRRIVGAAAFAGGVAGVARAAGRRADGAFADAAAEIFAPSVARSDLVVDVDVAILGAGAAGLAAAAECAQAGRSHLVVEARERVGGRVFTDASLGVPFDAGALYLHWGERNPWRAIAARLGVSLVGEPRSAFRVETRGVGAPTERAVRQRQFRRLGALLDGPQVEDLSVRAVAARAGLDAAAGGLTRMALGEEPERVSARDYARLWSGDDLVAPEGYGALLTRFAQGMAIRTGCAALGVRWGGLGVIVETTQGFLRARACVVTLPVGVLKSGAVFFAPALPAATRAALEGLEMGCLAKIALAFDGDRLGMDGPTDVILRDGETLIDFDCWSFGRPLVVAYVGGDAARALSRMGEEGAVATTLDALASVVGAQARSHFRAGRLHGWADDPFAHGSYSHALPGHAGARAALARPVGGRVFFAGEATGGEGGDFGGAMTAGGAYLAGREAARAACAVAAAGR
jgi:monoamine oxidase